MSKTIKELADESYISKSGIRKYMTSSFRTKYTFKNAGIKENKANIANHKSHLERTQSAPISTHKINKSVCYKNEIIEQLKQKDQQIQQLQKLLDQSQQLQLMAENKIKRLEDKGNESESKDLDKKIQSLVKKDSGKICLVNYLIYKDIADKDVGGTLGNGKNHLNS